MNRPSLLEMRPEGLYCPAGDFHIDPWRPVASALVTHAHSDHVRQGCGRYLCPADGEALLRLRIGRDARIRGIPYGETLHLGGVEVSFHPAGHILGSAQVRLALKGDVWVVSGDYKTQPDPTCYPFEPVRCRTFVTESTFALPVFRWEPAEAVVADIRRWWAENRESGRTSLLHVYALGKAQRVLASLGPDDGPVLVHGAVASVNAVYREVGVALCPTLRLTDVGDRSLLGRALVLAPASAAQPGWLRRFPAVSTAQASGWMTIRGFRRRRAFDRGFVLSDHCDWQGILAAIAATGAEAVWCQHGYGDALARYLREKGLAAEAVAARPAGAPEDEPLPGAAPASPRLDG